MKRTTKSNDKKITTQEARDTGMALVLILLLVAWFTHERWALIFSIIMLIGTMTVPRMYTLAAKGWLGFSTLLGAVMSKVVLSLIFFTVVSLLGITRRFFGYDPMSAKKWKNGNASVFIERNHFFEAKEIELPY